MIDKLELPAGVELAAPVSPASGKILIAEATELNAALHRNTATRHQREVSTGYFDEVSVLISGGESSTMALHGSTESEQFNQ